jgi:hypothetical protein
MAAKTHQGFKAQGLEDRTNQQEAKLKPRQLIQDATCSPVLEKQLKNPLAEDILHLMQSIHPEDQMER